MTLGTSAKKYLGMLKEEHRAFQADALSERHAINCFNLANALPEIILAEHGAGSDKVHKCRSVEEYRTYVRGRCEVHHIIRDLCDMAKHGMRLDRKSVVVRDAKPAMREEGVFRGLLALTQTESIERLVVTFKDGKTAIVNEILEEAIASWDEIFAEDSL